MKDEEKQTITVKADINIPVEKIWILYTGPEHIVKWNNASDDWHTTKAENNVRVGGRFLSRMEAKDGSDGFDFSGTYTLVEPFHRIDYTMDDQRKAVIRFVAEGDRTRVTVNFEAESENSPELQKTGWQAILNNFKQYAETNR